MVTSTSTFAQAFKPAAIDYNGQSTKFAIMVSDALHFESAMLTAQEMQIKEKGFKFEIIAVGILTQELIENKELVKTIEIGEELGVEIIVCENAMDFFGVDKTDLDSRLKTTKNGWVYMFELKDQGYNTLNGGWFFPDVK